MTLVSLLAAVLVTAEPVTHLCPSTPLAPVIDGRLDEPAWRAAPVVSGWFDTGPAGSPVADRLEIRLLHDAKALYVGGTVRLPTGRAPQAPRRERDGNLWGDDELELFLAPDGEGLSRFHLAVNAAGAIADSRSAPGLTVAQSVAWNPDWTVAVSSEPGVWRFEAAVPYAALGVDPPARGFVWLFKLGCVTPGAPNAMWPRNREHGFHNPAAWGALVFYHANLLRNADFEAEPDAKGRPPGWAYSYHPVEGEGVITLVAGGRPGGGRRCIDYHKTDDRMWFPQFWSEPVRVQPGATYRLSGWFRSAQPFVLRHTFTGRGKGEKHSQRLPAAPDWRELSYEFSVPPQFGEVIVGCMLSQAAGHILVDDLSLVRVNDRFAAAPALPEPDDRHRLEELAARRRFKPFALLKADGATDRPDGTYQTDRVIFKDTGTGATIVKLTRTGGNGSTRHTYMEMPPWNADGSLLMLNTAQLGRGTFLAPADGREWRRLAWVASGYQWDALDPSRVYYGERRGDEWALMRRRLGDAAGEELKRLTGEMSIWPPSRDGRKVLLRQTLTGADGPRSVIWVVDCDGRQATALHPPHRVHQTWFTKLPDYSVEYEYEGQKPRGQYVISLDNRVRQVTEETFGHRAHSPDGRWMAVIGRARIVSIDGKESRTLADVGSDHQTWRTSNDWFACSSGRHLSRVSTTGRFGAQRLGSHNSALKHSTYWSEAHPELSPDGTKLAYASNMLHDIEFYWLVMGLPEAPGGLRAERRGQAVELTWTRPRQSLELAGYLVYRSRQSGVRGELLTPQPVREPRFTDAGAGDGGWVYAVTAVEHSGLESKLSAAATVGTVTEPVLVLDAEQAQFTAPAEEVFDPSAADLRAVQLGATQPAGELTWAVPALPTTTVWVRARAARSSRGEPVASELRLALGDRTATATAERREWHWVKAGLAGTTTAGRLALSAPRPGVVVDQVVLAPASWSPPTGAALADDAPPPQPVGLQAEAAGPYAVRLRWAPVPAPDLHHYNVYCGRAGQVTASQERLVGSPSAGPFVDWGLQAGREYSYRVTAVDRAGNESPASEAATVSTPAVPGRLLVHREVKLLQGGTAEVPLELAQATSVVVWIRARSRSGKLQPYRLQATLDGGRLAEHAIAFDYVSLGHGGPVVDVPLWDVIRRPATVPGAAPGYEVPAGRHTVGLRVAPEADLLLDQVVVTNDLGWLPPGRCDFLIQPIRAESEPVG